MSSFSLLKEKCFAINEIVVHRGKNPCLIEIAIHVDGSYVNTFEADGVIISCPEYAHGVPGGLKNALDWLVSRDAAVAKPAMLAHASPRSLFARTALAEIVRTMSFALYEEAVCEIALLGKKPPEVEAILAEPESRLAMRDALAAFAEFIRTR